MILIRKASALCQMIIIRKAVHAKDQNLLQDMRSCNSAIIAGPDQSLPAQMEFSIKHTV